MMDLSSLLVSHPRPFPTESLSGYVLRLSELNGYVSPWSVLKLAEFQQSEMLRSNFDFERLSRIINWSAWNAGPLRDQFLVPELHAKEAKFCQDCVVEKGFIEAHWSLPLMVACPEHRSEALSYCPNCAKPIRWYRRGLLECGGKCEQILSGCPRSYISEAEASLLDIIRRKVLRREIPDVNPAAFPLSDLWALDLATLLRVISAVAKHRQLTDAKAIHKGERQTIQLAARTLEDWPSNFTTLLKKFARQQHVSEPKAAVALCKEVYRPLFTDFAHAPKKDTDFILSVLIEYAANEWDYRDAFQMKRFRDRLPTGLLSAREFNYQLKAGSIPPSRYLVSPADERNRQMGMDTGDAIFGLGGEGVIGLNLAAKRLGISPPLFKAIVENGFCKSRQLPSGGVTFSQNDIEHFKRSLLELVQTDDRPFTVDQCVSLRAALSWNWDSLETKMELLRALIDKRIEVVASFGNAVGDLQMDRATYHCFIAGVRERSAEESVSATEAAKVLQCDRTLIPGLVRSGALHGSDLSTGLRIDRVSLDGFTRNYVFVIKIARALHTNTARLARYCDRIGIPVTWPKRGSRDRVQPYIRTEDAKRVTEIVSAARAAKKADRSQKEAAVSKTTANEWRY